MVNSFSVVPVSLDQENAGAGSRRATSFYDYVIDGVALRASLRTADIGVLSNAWDSTSFARALLVEAERETALQGRAQIYGCRECLDLDCGGIAVTIAFRDNRVRWESIEKFWVTYDDAGDGAHQQFVFKPIKGGPYEFDLAQYRRTLGSFVTGPS